MGSAIIHNAHGIRITTRWWTETDGTETAAPIERGSMIITAGRKVIMEVVEVWSNSPNDAGRLVLSQDIILGGNMKWTVDRAVNIPNSSSTTGLPPPYSSLPTDTTAADNPETTVSVRDIFPLGAAASEWCKHVSIKSGLTPGCELLLDLPMASTRGHFLDPARNPLVTVLGPWSVYQRQSVSPPPSVPRLLTPPHDESRLTTSHVESEQYTKPSGSFCCVAAVIRRLRKGGTSKKRG